MSLLKVGTSTIKAAGGGALRAGKALLTSNDLELLGIYRFPYSTWNLADGGQPLAMRTVGAETRLFTFTYDGSPAERKLLEFSVPTGDAPSMTLSTAPRMTYVRDYGDIWSGMVTSSGLGGAWAISGLRWDESLHGLWWHYSDGYAPSPNSYHPTVGFTYINPTTHATSSYGPWRQQEYANSVFGMQTQIPAWFADAYTNGHRWGVVSGAHSGYAECQVGCNLIVQDLPDPFTAAADTTAARPYAGQYTIGNQRILFHDIDRPQARDQDWAICSWSKPGDAGHQHYDCRLNEYIDQGPATWSGPVGVTYTEEDSAAGGVWVDTPTKHGLVFFGQLITTPSAYTPPGGSQWVHAWYGDPTHASTTGSTGAGYVDGSCCHGQDDTWWGATGPGAHYRVPHSWIYNPMDLIAPAQGSAVPWSVTPAEVKQWVDAGDGLISWPLVERRSNRAGFITQPYYDTANQLIYLMLRKQDTTSVYGNATPSIRQPIVLVFQVN